MSSSSAQLTYDPRPFERTVESLKQGVHSATSAHAEAAEKAARTAKQLAAFNQGSLEALAQSSQIFAAGMVELARQMTTSSQSAMAEGLNGFRSLILATTVKERIELQVSLARSGATWAVSEYARFAQAGIDLVARAAAPLTERAALASEAMKTIKI